MLLPIFASDQSSRVRERIIGLYTATSLAFGAGLAAMFAAAAHAADATTPPPWSQLLLKAPPARATSFDWTGFYVGGHVSYSRGNARVTVVDDDPTNFSHRFGSLTGGLQGGYNYVLPSRFVLGIEADMSFPNYLSADDVVWFRTTPDTDIAEKIDFMSTVRGRLGYAFDHWMVYATGGFAWSLGRFLQTPGAVDDIDKALHLHTGWAAGAGAEVPIAPSWIARLEYLYRNFGHAEVTFPSGTTAGSSYDVHMIRGGLNYKLGSPTAYVPDFAASQTQFPNWEIHGQTTYIQQGYPPFRSPYLGENSFTRGRKHDRPGPPARFSASSCGTAASSTTIPSCYRASGCTTRRAPPASPTAKRKSRTFLTLATARRACFCGRHSGSAASRKPSRAATAKWRASATSRG
jgi:high affinity Mn2+ porin